MSWIIDDITIIYYCMMVAFWEEAEAISPGSGFG